MIRLLARKPIPKKGDPEAAQSQNAALIGVLVGFGIIVLLGIIATISQ